MSFTTAPLIFLRKVEVAENEVIAHSAAPRGHVRLTAPISFGVLRIAPIMPEFLALYPDVTIDLHLSDAHVDLVGEGYDAAIRIASLPDSSLIVRTLAPVSRYLVAAPSYLSKYGRPPHPLRLSEQAAEKEAAARRATERQILEDAEHLIAVWNERQAKRMPMLFSPTIGAAIASGYWFLRARCPACRTTGDVDLRYLPFTDRDVRAINFNQSCRNYEMRNAGSRDGK